MKILVLGGHGQAGTEFVRLAQNEGLDVFTPTRAELDVRASDQLRQCIVATSPSMVVNLTGFHVLEECETAFGEALRVNATSVRDMAVASNRVGARLVTVSTDYVFDGAACTPYAEDATAAPIQAYGISKRAGELAALAANSQGTIIARTCGLYGKALSRTRGANFVDRRLADLSRMESIEVGNDLRCTPTSALAFARALLSISLNADVSAGTYHLTDEGECSWAEFTSEIARVVNSKCRVVGVNRRGNYGIVRRPPYSVLLNRLAAGFGIRLPDWRDDLGQYLKGIR